MAFRVEIRCINKSNRANHYERISFVGGVNPDGTRWKLSEADAIAGIKMAHIHFTSTEEVIRLT